MNGTIWSWYSWFGLSLGMCWSRRSREPRSGLCGVVVHILKLNSDV
jgi:hypothetical protein